jgi:hypothetical protein
MRLWSRLPGLADLAAGFRKPRIATPDSLAGFMAEQSAFVAQKCTIDYCQARSGLMWPQLEKEQSFRDALDRARWEAYPLVLSDVGIMIEGLMRPVLQPASVLPFASWLTVTYADCLNRYGPPKHRDPGSSWEGDVEHFRHRLGQAQMAAPRPVHEVGGESGTALHRLMPMHPSLTKLDAPMIANNVKLRLARVYEDLERQGDLPAVAAHFKVV